MVCRDAGLCRRQLFRRIDRSPSPCARRRDGFRAGAAAPVTIDFASLQDFDKNSQRSYPPREESYALIVAASSGWENYRHQAGAYLMYQMLKSNGLDDDHILLVSEDDIARHS